MLVAEVEFRSGTACGAYRWRTLATGDSCVRLFAIGLFEARLARRSSNAARFGAALDRFGFGHTEGRRYGRRPVGLPTKTLRIGRSAGEPQAERVTEQT